MPERDKQVDGMARIIAGADPKPFRDPLGTAPEGMDAAVWAEHQATAEHAYVDAVENIDFARVLIEARNRHLVVHNGESTFTSAMGIGHANLDDLCGECVREVLLATGTRPNWDAEPESPRYVLFQPEVYELVAPGADLDEDEPGSI